MQDAAAATHKLAHYFEEVDTVMESLERQLFAAAEDFLRLGCNEPAVLVRMVQVSVRSQAGGLEAERCARRSVAHAFKSSWAETTKRWTGRRRGLRPARVGDRKSERD
jgi:hypothetical protein